MRYILFASVGFLMYVAVKNFTAKWFCAYHNFVSAPIFAHNISQMVVLLALNNRLPSFSKRVSSKKIADYIVYVTAIS